MKKRNDSILKAALTGLIVSSLFTSGSLEAMAALRQGLQKVASAAPGIFQMGRQPVAQAATRASASAAPKSSAKIKVKRAPKSPATVNAQEAPKDITKRKVGRPRKTEVSPPAPSIAPTPTPKIEPVPNNPVAQPVVRVGENLSAEEPLPSPVPVELFASPSSQSVFSMIGKFLGFADGGDTTRKQNNSPEIEPAPNPVSGSVLENSGSQKKSGADTSVFGFISRFGGAGDGSDTTPKANNSLQSEQTPHNPVNQTVTPPRDNASNEAGSSTPSTTSSASSSPKVKQRSARNKSGKIGKKANAAESSINSVIPASSAASSDIPPVGDTALQATNSDASKIEQLVDNNGGQSGTPPGDNPGAQDASTSSGTPASSAASSSDIPPVGDTAPQGTNSGASKIEQLVDNNGGQSGTPSGNNPSNAVGSSTSSKASSASSEGGTQNNGSQGSNSTSNSSFINQWQVQAGIAAAVIGGIAVGYYYYKNYYSPKAQKDALRKQKEAIYVFAHNLKEAVSEAHNELGLGQRGYAMRSAQELFGGVEMPSCIPEKAARKLALKAQRDTMIVAYEKTRMLIKNWQNSAQNTKAPALEWYADIYAGKNNDNSVVRHLEREYASIEQELAMMETKVC